MSRLPPCCASCPELDNRACKLLADASRASRVRLYTMPCDARRLLRQRFRGYGDEVALVAQERWESDAVSAGELHEALGAGPLDARVWLGMFPFDALASASVEAAHGRRAGGVAPA
ncbi:MAG TPA: hypothetical protein VL400_00785, partial [Polyangiaceae bacterium]|nr:hypothetical protein [Polyangiaceae bacterium]